MQPKFLLLLALLSKFLLAGTQAEPGNSGIISGQEVRAVFICSNGVKWFGTREGLVRFDGVTWDRLGSDGLPFLHEINDLWVDESYVNPSIWIAASSGLTIAEYVQGVLSVQVTYSRLNGMLADNIVSICRDSKGLQYAASAPGINYLDGNTWKSITYESYPESIANAPVKSIHTRKDSLYVGTSDGIGRFVNSLDGITGASRWTSEFGMSPLSGDITAVFIDSKGNQWFGTSIGLQKHEGILAKSGWFEITGSNGLVNKFILTIAESLTGEIWVGTKGGAFFLTDERWQSLHRIDGLASDTVYDIAFDRDSSAWLATHDGISHYKSGSFLDLVPSREAGKGNPIVTLRNIPGINQVDFIFHLTEPITVNISIYEISGKMVTRIRGDDLQPGRNIVTWNADRENQFVKPGIYIYRIAGNGWIIAGKLYLIN